MKQEFGSSWADSMLELRRPIQPKLHQNGFGAYGKNQTIGGHYTWIKYRKTWNDGVREKVFLQNMLSFQPLAVDEFCRRIAGQF